MSTIESARFPKYGCRQCGSVTIRGSYDEFPVFEAKGDAIVFLHTDRDLLIPLKLTCFECGTRLEVDDIGDIEII